MMRSLILLFFLLSSASNADTSVSESKKSAAKDMFSKRMQLLYSKNYDGYQSCNECWDNIRSASESNEYEKVILEADKGVVIEPFSLRFLIAKSDALRKLGRIEESDGVRKEWFSIADSILMSGDGQTKETAYIVLRVNEEYSILALLGLKSESQSLIHDDDKVYDVFEAAHIETGEKYKVYFDITVVFNSLESKFGGK